MGIFISVIKVEVFVIRCLVAHRSPWYETSEPPIGVQLAITLNFEMDKQEYKQQTIFSYVS